MRKPGDDFAETSHLVVGTVADSHSRNELATGLDAQWRLGFSRAEQSPLYPQTDQSGRRGHDAQIRLLTRAPVAKQQLVAAHRLELGALQRRNSKAPARKPAREIAPGRGRDHDIRRVAMPIRGARNAAVVTVERDVVRDEEAHRVARRHGNRQRQLVRIAARLATDLNHAGSVTVDPKTRLRRHLECGRHVEQLPFAAELDEHTLPVRPEQAEVAVYGREHAVDVDVALGQHRIEHAAHPDS